MKFNSAFFSSLFALSFVFTSLNVFAENTTNNDRWFEVEVILFHQLNDKNALKEQFPEGINGSNLPDYPQSFDLLERYLQPNLSNIKRFVPLCGEADEQQLFLESLQSVSLPSPIIFQDMDSVITTDITELKSTSPITENTHLPDQITDENRNAINNEPNGLTADENVTLSTALASFEFDLQKDTLAKPLFATNEICIISEQDIHNLFDEQQLTGFKLDAFSVAGLPNRIKAPGIHTDDKPYLIADDALLLKDINQRLGWSREFKPLFHFGWRQIGITEQKAIPLKLIAGKHFDNDYQQALVQIQQEIKTANSNEQNLLEQLAINQQEIENIDKVDSEIFNNKTKENDESDEYSQRNLKQNQQALAKVFANIDVIDDQQIGDDVINEIVSSIENQTLESVLNNNQHTEQDNHLREDDLITKPIQPWFLEGFIKIHLDHYLYITADLNVFNQNDASKVIENNKADKIKLVNFSQNRRVITGEIHYFDHPYIGMIVQIRRFDPTKPKGEQVSQAIK